MRIPMARSQRSIWGERFGLPRSCRPAWAIAQRTARSRTLPMSRAEADAGAAAHATAASAIAQSFIWTRSSRLVLLDAVASVDDQNGTGDVRGSGLRQEADGRTRPGRSAA